MTKDEIAVIASIVWDLNPKYALRGDAGLKLITFAREIEKLVRDNKCATKTVIKAERVRVGEEV
jgi:uncharacterized protein YajQ (UPF0234 family)